MFATRRDFLKKTLGASTLLALGPTAPALLHRAAQAAPPSGKGRDTILVVVQLAGGNDGLNTVVPYEDDLYARYRTTLRLRSNQVLKIGSDLGLHPSLPSFLKLYQDGLLSVVQGVGYPNPHQGHTESMHIWQTADITPGRGQTGWLGRAIDQESRSDPGSMPGVFVGQLAQPFTMNAERAIVPSIQSPADAALHGLPGDGPAQRRRRMETVGVDRKGKGSPLLDFVQKNTLAAFQESQKKEAALKTFGSPQAGYPSFQLARMFHLVAQLIRADVGIRIFCTELGGQEPGGFDTHAGQAANHGALLEQLSESVAAFLKDLKQDRLLDRVLLMTYSEFGRTVLENGRRGTDHGSAAPLFLAGGRVKGGLVGSHPDLKNLENGGQKHHTDFRRVYATVLENWLGIDSQTVLEGRFKALDVIQG